MGTDELAPGGNGTGVVWSLGVVPVQEWIAEARRSRDLLAGSAILSWLMERLLARLRQAKATVDLPTTTADRARDEPRAFAEFIRRPNYGIPNRASGHLPLMLTSAAGLFRELERETRAGWDELKREIGEDAARSSHSLWRLVAPAVEAAPCPFHVVWCIQDATEGGMESIDRLYAAVKRNRVVMPHQGAPVPKCVQCGRREASGGRDMASWRQFQTQLTAEPAVRAGLRIEPGERLCGVCLLKRLAGYLRSEAFPSTSEIAARTWSCRVQAIPELRDHLASLRAAIRAVPGYERSWVDAAPLLYRRSVDRELRQARETGDEERRATLDTVVQHHRRLGEAIGKRRTDYGVMLPAQPPTYLSVVTFDGDDVGRKMREVAGLAEQIARFHSNLVERLRLAAGNDCPGEGLASAEPFYLGGDEGLLLSPAGEVLDVVSAIRGMWRSAMAPLGNSAPTLSAGVAIFDRERPLGAAIETAQEALELAKQRRTPRSGEGKNALAVTVSTASGSRWSAVAGWDEAWPRMRAALALLRDGRLAGGWPHDVERFLRSVDDEVWTMGDTARAAVREEVKRLTFRRAQPVRDVSEGHEAWKALTGDSWWERQPEEQERSAMGDLLHLVGFLAGQERRDAI